MVSFKQKSLEPLIDAPLFKPPKNKFLYSVSNLEVSVICTTLAALNIILSTVKILSLKYFSIPIISLPQISSSLSHVTNASDAVLRNVIPYLMKPFQTVSKLSLYGHESNKPY